ncbi:DDE-type integrase/transposase/recombinase [Streptomyces sp. NPDC005474]|uniref:DDE-type integrase/transposase/recombinase n=1 Tax=Streptomyces sp. NPDC005474 TaxID=3154878 RepID=UPI003454B388
MREEGKLKVSLSTFRRWATENLPDEAARSKVTVLRDDVEPGSEAQIDYGFLGQWFNPTTGKRHRIWAFVMVLPASRHMFVRPVVHMDQHSWTVAHVEAFRYFGGVPRRLVPDNLKTGVDKPDLYDPQINKSYAELATYYGTLVDPARALHPKDKPRVERPMPYVRDSLWSGRQFTSLEHMQAEALPLGAGTSRVSGSAGRWAGPSRWRSSRQWRPRPSFRCRPSRSCWPDGRRLPSARTFTSKSAAPCIRCPGDWSGGASTSVPPPRWCRSSTRASWSRRTPLWSRASAPTEVTIRPRRSLSRCGRRSGAAAKPRRSETPAGR